MMYDYFVRAFSLYNETLKEELLSSDATCAPRDFCYLDVHSTFMKYCHYEYYVSIRLEKLNFRIGTQVYYGVFFFKVG